MSLTELHARLGNTAVYYMVIMAGWGLWRFRISKGQLLGALVIGEIIILLLGAWEHTCG